MRTIGLVAVVSGVLVAVYGCCMLRRNSRVYKFRAELLDVIEPGRPDFFELMAEFNKVSYHQLMRLRNSFIPPEEFYEGSKLIEAWRKSKGC